MKAIVNVTPEWGIGSENRLLVRIREDMRRFRSITSHHTIVIGRKTLETFPNRKPLPNRENIVLTRDPGFVSEGAVICRSVDELRLVLAQRDPDSVYVCGGEQIYRLLLPYCSAAYVTWTETDEKADRFFPNLNQLPNWFLKSASDPAEEEGIRYRFLEYENSEPLSLI